MQEDWSLRHLRYQVSDAARYSDASILLTGMSVDWFPMGGPIFGASGKINLAFYDALKSMNTMSLFLDNKDIFSARAEKLKSSILLHLWNAETGTMRTLLLFFDPVFAERTLNLMKV